MVHVHDYSLGQHRRENETKQKIGPIISLHVIVAFNPNSGVTYGVFLQILKPCAFLFLMRLTTASCAITFFRLRQGISISYAADEFWSHVLSYSLCGWRQHHVCYYIFQVKARHSYSLCGWRILKPCAFLFLMRLMTASCAITFFRLRQGIPIPYAADDGFPIPYAADDSIMCYYIFQVKARHSYSLCGWRRHRNSRSWHM